MLQTSNKHKQSLNKDMYDLDYIKEFNDDGNQGSENIEENQSRDLINEFENINEFDDFKTDLSDSMDDANF